MDATDLPLAERLSASLATQRAAYRAHPEPGYAERKDDLKRLRAFLREHQDELVAAISADYGHRSRHETLLCEIAPAVDGIGYALKHRAHVRIDVFSSRWSARTVARVEVLGIALLLLPFCAALVWFSLDYVAMSWRMGERSGSTGGLAGLYLAKTLLPAGAALLALQGIAEALRTLPVALGREAQATAANAGEPTA